MKADYLDILKLYWGYESFRGIQEEIVSSVGNGKDTLGLMPTGGGKSITFQVPSMATEGTCLVVTPLIALMKDQVANLRRRGIKAVAVHSGMRREEILVALENCIFGDYKFLYISPERLTTDLFRTKLRAMKVNMITVDEAHCISQWGYDFRPSYLRIAEIRKLLPGVPVLALTATATPKVVEDIQKKLEFAAENAVRMSFERKNLAYIVRHTEDKTVELIHILSRLQGSAIVYTRNRMKTKEIAKQIQQSGISAAFYHAGLSDSDKDTRQKAWTQGEVRVMVATNAFGMGIDKPDVRLVIHVDIPDSPEAYFQEAGRAGRDGAKAYAVLLACSGDESALARRLSTTYPEKSYVRKVYEDLQYYYQMAMGDGLGCSFSFDIYDFCTCFHHSASVAESALHLLTAAGYIDYSEEQDNSSRMMITVGREELYRLHEGGEELERLLRVLLRTYTGLFSEYTNINEDVLSQRAGLKREEVYNFFVYLTRRGVMNYIPGRNTPRITYLRERRDASKIILDKEVYDLRKKSFAERIDFMRDYAFGNFGCRSMMLLRYFGENKLRRCGQCDYCLSRHFSGLRKGEFEDIMTAVKNELGNSDGILADELVRRVDFPREKTLKALDFMLREEMLSSDGVKLFAKCKEFISD